MLKIGTTSVDGKRSLWIGLSQDNLDRLPENPIMFDLAELDGFIPDRIVIVAGPTNTVIADRLRALGLPVPEVPEPSSERFESRS